MIEVGVDQVLDVLTRLDSRSMRVYPRQCTKLRHRRSTCTLCADACPVQAIAWDDSVQVDPDRCTGCGVCATVCPTGVFEARSPTNTELLIQIKELAQEREWLAFACPRYREMRSKEAEPFMQVPCLGRLDESILIGAVSMGISAVWLMDGACQECPQAGGRTVAGTVVERSNAWLQAFGIAQRIAFSPHLPPELSEKARQLGAVDGPSRRAFFSLLARETARTAAVTMESVRGDHGSLPEEAQAPRRGELPTHLPAKRQLLLGALRRLSRPGGAGTEISRGLVAQLDFKATCTGCQMCAFFCPTGALTKAEQDGRAGVAFRVAHCVDCGLCRDVCYCDAVVIASDVDLGRMVDDAAEVILMREADGVPWEASPKERTKRLLAAMYPGNE